MMDVRAQVVAWAGEGAIPGDRLDAALRASGVTPDAARWGLFLERLLVWLGAVLMAAAATYFLAANWAALGRYAKFAMAEGALVVAVAVACWRGLDTVAGRAALFAAALLTGVLLALVGQVYQTGADTYELFAAWAFFVVPFAVAGRQPALWILLVALVDLAIVMYFRTSVARGFGTLDLVFAPRTALWCVVAFNGVALVAWEVLAARRGGFLAVRWAPRLIATSLGAGVTFLAMEYVVAWWDKGDVAALAAYGAFAAAMYWAYRVRALDLFMLAGLAASAILLAASAFARAIVPQGGMVAFLLVALLIAAAAAGAARWLRGLSAAAREETA